MDCAKELVRRGADPLYGFPDHASPKEPTSPSSPSSPEASSSPFAAIQVGEEKAKSLLPHLISLALLHGDHEQEAKMITFLLGKNVTSVRDHPVPKTTPGAKRWWLSR